MKKQISKNSKSNKKNANRSNLKEKEIICSKSNNSVGIPNIYFFYILFVIFLLFIAIYIIYKEFCYYYFTYENIKSKELYAMTGIDYEILTAQTKYMWKETCSIHDIWPVCLLYNIFDPFLNLLFNYGIYKMFFVIWTTIFHIFYDKLKSTHISYIYQKDKYGVVLTYMLLCFVEMLIYSSHIIFDAVEWRNKNVNGIQRTLNEALRLVGINVMLTFIKISTFNGIFKNHTEKNNTAYSTIHIICVIATGIIAFLIKMFQVDFFEIGEGIKLPRYIFLKDFEILIFSIQIQIPLIILFVLRIVCFGVSYKLTAYMAENAPSINCLWLFNFFSVVFEALLVITII